jgi:hypothetical protein
LGLKEKEEELFSSTASSVIKEEKGNRKAKLKVMAKDLDEAKAREARGK